jgi:hypothetical protein
MRRLLFKFADRIAVFVRDGKSTVGGLVTDDIVPQVEVRLVRSGRISFAKAGAPADRHVDPHFFCGA